jgi:transcriptional regulator with XRE-family HTH domain
VARLDVGKLLIGIGLRVAEIRGGRDLTQEQLAQRANVKLGHLRRIERGSSNIKFDTLARIAGALDVMPSDLLAAPGITSRPVGRPKKRVATRPRATRSKGRS